MHVLVQDEIDGSWRSLSPDVVDTRVGSAPFSFLLRALLLRATSLPPTRGTRCRQRRRTTTLASPSHMPALLAATRARRSSATR